jgi:hypothetical protein
MKAAQSQKKSERESERAADGAQDAAEEAQVEAMRQKAAHVWKAALRSGLTEIAMGGFDVVAANAKVGGSEATSDELKGTGRAIEGVGKLGAGYFDSEKALDDAHATQHEHEAGHAKRAYDEAHDRVKDADKLFDDAISFYREFVTSQNQAKKAAIHGA